jgi:hypothetical protein
VLLTYRLFDRHHVVVGLHPYRCEVLGADASRVPELVALDPDLTLRQPVAVVRDAGRLVAAARFDDLAGQPKGIGTWVIAGAEVGAVDPAARQVSGRVSSLVEHPPDAATAARLCLGKS